MLEFYRGREVVTVFVTPNVLSDSGSRADASCPATQSQPHMPEIGAFVYKLLMSGTGWNANQDTVSSDRVFEYTIDPLVARFKPNGVLEMGLARMLGKEVIMVTQSASDVPFDMQRLPYIKYLGNDEGRAELATAVARRLGDLEKTQFARLAKRQAAATRRYL